MNEMKKAYNREKSVNQFLLIIITIMDLFLFLGISVITAREISGWDFC